MTSYETGFRNRTVFADAKKIVSRKIAMRGNNTAY